MNIIDITPTHSKQANTKTYLTDEGKVYTTYDNHEQIEIINGMELYPKKTNTDGVGYVGVKIARKGYYVHRLVAELFVPNPDHKPVVNHKDGNKGNNDVSNLEWLTFSENSNHAYRTGLIKRWGKGYCNACNKLATTTWCVEEFDDRRVQWRAHRDLGPTPLKP